MKKIFILSCIVLLFNTIIHAQTPVQITQPYNFLKYIQVKDSISTQGLMKVKGDSVVTARKLRNWDYGHLGVTLTDGPLHYTGSTFTFYNSPSDTSLIFFRGNAPSTYNSLGYIGINGQLFVGSSNTSNNRIALWSESYSNAGILGISWTNTAAVFNNRSGNTSDILHCNYNDNNKFKVNKDGRAFSWGGSSLDSLWTAIEMRAYLASHGGAHLKNGLLMSQGDTTYVPYSTATPGSFYWYLDYVYGYLRFDSSFYAKSVNGDALTGISTNGFGGYSKSKNNYGHVSESVNGVGSSSHSTNNTGFYTYTTNGYDHALFGNTGDSVAIRKDATYHQNNGGVEKIKTTITGDIDIKGQYKINGVPISSGGSTDTSAINNADVSLTRNKLITTTSHPFTFTSTANTNANLIFTGTGGRIWEDRSQPLPLSQSLPFGLYHGGISSYISGHDDNGHVFGYNVDNTMGPHDYSKPAFWQQFEQSYEIQGMSICNEYHWIKYRPGLGQVRHLYMLSSDSLYKSLAAWTFSQMTWQTDVKTFKVYANLIPGLFQIIDTATNSGLNILPTGLDRVTSGQLTLGSNITSIAGSNVDIGSSTAPMSNVYSYKLQATKNINIYKKASYGTPPTPTANINVIINYPEKCDYPYVFKIVDEYAETSANRYFSIDTFGRTIIGPYKTSLGSDIKDSALTIRGGIYARGGKFTTKISAGSTTADSTITGLGIHGRGGKFDTNITANDLSLSKTIIAPGTTGDQTINKATGRVNIAAAGTSITITNSLVTTNSIIVATCATNDATAWVKNVVVSSGSFVITLGAAATAETAINFIIIN